MIVPLFGTGFASKSVTVTAQHRINVYSEPQSPADKAPIAYYGTPGLTLFANFGSTPIRGRRTVGDFVYLVAGDTLYSVDAANNSTTLGTLNSSSGVVSMSDNGDQLAIVDGITGYIYDIGSGLPPDPIINPKLATPAAFPNGTTSITFIAGRFVCPVPGASGQFQWSGLYDGRLWDALDFATAESNPDPLVGVSSDHGQLILYGKETTEIWYPTPFTDANNVPDVFDRVGGAGLEWGLAALHSLDRFGDSEIFIAKNRMGQFDVVVMDKGTVRSLTDQSPNIAAELNARPGVASATGYSYRLDGHSFYQVNFSDRSYLYNSSANDWIEVQSSGGRHYGELRFELLARNYVTDYRNGNVYLVDPMVYTDNGETITREIITSHIFNDLERFSVWSLQAEFEAGVGLATGQGSDPQVMLQMSYDGGHTWGQQRLASIGPMGHYRRRAIWRQLGRCRDAVFRLRVTDPVKFTLANAAMRVG